MKVKFSVLGVGETSFTSPKSGRTFNRTRLIGMAFDAYDGSQQPAVADLSFDSPPPRISQGETYLLDCVGMDTKNAMLSLTFKDAEPFKTSKG